LERDFSFFEERVPAKDNNPRSVPHQGHAEGDRREHEGAILQRNADGRMDDSGGDVPTDRVEGARRNQWPKLEAPGEGGRQDGFIGP